MSLTSGIFFRYAIDSYIMRGFTLPILGKGGKDEKIRTAT